MFKLKSFILFLGFAGIIILMLMFGVTALQKLKNQALFTEKLYQHPLTVSNAVLEVNTNIVAIHRHMKDVALAQNDQDLNLAITKVNDDEQRVFRLFDIIFERFLGDKSRIIHARQVFADWKPIRSEVIKLMQDGQYNEAAAITKGKGAKYVAVLTLEMDGLIDFARNKAAEFLANSKQEQSEGQYLLKIMLTVIVLLSLVIALTVWSVYLHFERHRSLADKKLRKAHEQLEDKVKARTIDLNHEIEERKGVEIALRESEAFFRGYFELDLIGMALTSLEKKWVGVNDKLCEIFGYSTEELTKLTWTEITHPDDIEAEAANFNRVLAGESSGCTMDKRFIRKDGEIIYASISVKSVVKEDGSTKHFLVFIEDITQRKFTERALAQSEQRYRRLVEQTQGDYFIYSHDINGVFRYVSPSVHNVLGYEVDEFANHFTTYLTDNPLNREAQRLTALCVKGESQACYEVEILHKYGDAHILELSAHPTLDAEGQVIAVEGIAHDITARKKSANWR